MRILLVSHNLPPHGTAGTETYVAELAQALAARGHDVTAFAAVKDVGRRDLALLRRQEGRVAVLEVVNNLYHADFRGTWEHPRVERLFAAALRELRPEVVHVNHLLYLSAGCVRLARESGARVVFTLHDFWLECARMGQRVHADGGLCDRIDFARCGTCLTQFAWRQPRLARAVGPVIAELHERTGVDLSGVARRTRRRVAPPAPAPEAGPEAAALARAAEERWSGLRERVLPNVDLFLSPSRFLRERFVAEWGLPPARIEHLRFGIDRARFGGPRIPAADVRLRVGFLGQLVPLKGPHVLLDAWERLAPELRARASLVLHGPAREASAYRDELVRRARALGAEVGGPLARDAVGPFLRATDLLVVPSLWFENSPLAIQEALACRTPLAVSDLGGMAELVEPGISGFRFPPGDADALARVLGEAIADRGRLDRLFAAPPRIPTFDEHVDALLARYAP